MPKPSLTITKYLIGLLVIFATAYSQYLVSGFGLIAGAFAVYGVSIIVITPMRGAAIVRPAFKNTASAIRLGLGLFGIFTLVSILASVVILSLLTDLDPGAVSLLHRPVPVLNVPPHLAWIMVWLSILVVGPAEEYIFRGFVYGGLLSISKGGHWLLLAFLSSVFFAAVHLYYALTYGVASLIPFVDIVAIGMALAITYYRSGGNLLIPALIHGVYDATGFLAVAISSNLGLYLRGLLIFISIIVALTVFGRHRPRKPLGSTWVNWS